MTAKNSRSGEVTITASDTTTVALRAPNTWPAPGMQDIAVWNEATFWPAFGGKKTTITWTQ